jgi:predicted lipase
MKLHRQDFLFFCKYYSAYRFSHPSEKKQETEKHIRILQTWDRKHAQGFTAEKDGTLYFCHMGSNEGIDWLFNFRFFRKKIPYNGTNPKIKVHTGFIETYKLVRDIVQAQVGGFRKIIVSGHSLGAALATLCALDLQYNFPHVDIACLITGSPRVGNTYFADSFDRRVPDTYRMVYQDDIVTRVPFRWMAGFGKRRYTHVSKEIHLGRKRRLWRFFSIKDHDIVGSYCPEIARLRSA